jgi:hypothetical protein
MNQGPRWILLMQKTRAVKSRATVPVNLAVHSLQGSFIQPGILYDNFTSALIVSLLMFLQEFCYFSFMIYC